MREPGTIENGVLIGRRDHLFLANGAHQVLDTVTGRRKVPDDAFEILHRNVTLRQSHAKSIGADYMHIIFPDKQTVLPGDFPCEHAVSLGSLATDYCLRRGQKIYYPLDLLRGLDAEPFRKTDTHLSSDAQLRVAADISLGIMGRSDDPDLASFSNLRRVRKSFIGDLGKKLSPAASSIEEFIQTNWALHSFSNGLAAGSNGIVEIYFAPESISDKRLLWFGDSFGRDCCKFLSFFFREILFIRSRYFHAEVSSQMNPDVLITENVERYLDNTRSDEERPSFFMYPYSSLTNFSPSTGFAEAFSAILSYKRPPYLEFIEKLKGTVDPPV